MSLKVRKNAIDFVLGAVVDEVNRMREAAVTTEYHASVTAGPSSGRPPTASAYIVTAANATDLATSLALVNQIKAVYNEHAADDVAHDSAVSDVITTDDAVDLTTAEDLANELKAAINVHYTEANVHFNNDAANTIAAADATDQGTLDTLINSIKTKLNTHIQNALAGHSLVLIDP